MSNDNLKFSCSNCDSNSFESPSNPKPTDIVSCTGCGASGSFGVIKQQMDRQSIQSVKKAPAE